jgi:Uma2 family endonuclease
MSRTSTIPEPQPIPSRERRYTYRELVAASPVSNQPCELRDGEIVMSPAPTVRHQRIAFRFHRQLHDWVEGHALGEVLGAPIDMVLAPHQVVQPDVLFVSRERMGIAQAYIMGPADLVAEVVSLGGRNRDRIEKRDLYEQYGVKEYWIIDPEAQTVEVLGLEGVRYEILTRARLRETAESRLLSGFRVDVSALLAD